MTTTPEARLHAERNIWMATTRPDGRPHLAPVWFVYVDDALWIGTGRGAVRTANLHTNANAAASLEDGDQPIVAEGSVVIHERTRPPAVVDAFLDKYGWDIRIDEDVDVGQVVVLELRPRKWLFADLPTLG